MTKAGIGHAIFSFILNLIMQYSFQILWCMMNTLQLIVHLPMFLVNFPDLAIQFSELFQALS